MKYCSYCGNEMNDYDSFCSKCGKGVNGRTRSNSSEDGGSAVGGFALGFLVGLAGLIIGICLEKPVLRKWAIIGYLSRAAISVIVAIINYGLIMQLIQQIFNGLSY